MKNANAKAFDEDGRQIISDEGMNFVEVLCGCCAEPMKITRHHVYFDKNIGDFGSFCHADCLGEVRVKELEEEIELELRDYK